MKRMATPNGYYKRRASHYARRACEWIVGLSLVVVICAGESIVDNLLKTIGL